MSSKIVMFRLFNGVFATGLGVALLATTTAAAQQKPGFPGFTRPSDGVPSRPAFKAGGDVPASATGNVCAEPDKAAYGEALKAKLAIADANVAAGRAYTEALDARLKVLLANEKANAEPVSRIRAEMGDFDAPYMDAYHGQKALKAALDKLAKCPGGSPAAPTAVASASPPTAGAPTQLKPLPPQLIKGTPKTPAKPAAAPPAVKPAAPAPAKISEPIEPPKAVAAAPPAPILPLQPVAPGPVPPLAAAMFAVPPAPVVAEPVSAPAPVVLAEAAPAPGPITTRGSDELIVGRRPALAAAEPIRPAPALPIAAPSPSRDAFEDIVQAAVPPPKASPAQVAPQPVKLAAAVPGPSPAPAIISVPASGSAKAPPLNDGGSGVLPARTVVWRTTGKDGHPFTAEVSLAPGWALKRGQLTMDWSGAQPNRYAFNVLEGDWANRPANLERTPDDWVSYVIVELDNGQTVYLKRPDLVKRNYLNVATSDRVFLPKDAKAKKIEMVFGKDAEGATAVWDFQ